MQLRNEGAIQAAPVLKDAAAQKVSLALQQWDGMQAVTHWQLGDSEKVDGAEFHVDDKELGHIHLHGGVHLLLTRQLSKALIAKGLAEEFPWGAEWVQASLESEDDVERAMWLFKLGYDRLRGGDDEAMLERVRLAGA